MTTIKTQTFNFLLLTLLFCIAKNAAAMQSDKENQVAQVLATVKAHIQRPSTPLNPENFYHRDIVKYLQTPDGRPVTADDAYNYLGFYPTR